MNHVKELELELFIAKKRKLDPREIANLERLLAKHKKPQPPKKTILQSIVTKLLTFVIFALFVVNNLYPQNPITIYELIIDFGNDFTFIHETTKSEEHCRFRAITISIKENVNAYCVKRKG
jgi:hypothetical protein